jgi:uncharacterized protein (DUF58 family)
VAGRGAPAPANKYTKAKVEIKVEIKAKKILLKTKKQVFGDMLGNNASLFHGEGFEFAELREYVYGDDIRKIDWKTTAKLGKPYVKIYREERELNVAISTMLGGSTYFGTCCQKSEYMAQLVAMIGFSAVKNSDPFSHMIFADRLYHHSGPSKKIHAVKNEIERILDFDTLGLQSNFSDWTDTVFKRVRKKSLLFLISDFVGDIDLRLLSRKHDVFAIIVRDRFEEEPQGLGYIRLVDTEGQGSFEGEVGPATLRRYRAALKENDHKLYKHFRKNGIRYAKLYTDEDPAAKLLKRMR